METWLESLPKDGEFSAVTNTKYVNWVLANYQPPPIENFIRTATNFVR